MQLKHGGTLRPCEVPHPRRYESKGARRQSRELGFIEGLTHPDFELAGNHRHVLIGGVKVRRETIPVRNLQPHGEWNRLGGIALQNRQFCAGWQQGWCRSPRGCFRSNHNRRSRVSGLRGPIVLTHHHRRQNQTSRQDQRASHNDLPG